MSDRWTLHVGDCTEVLQTLPDESIDAIVCDPPYGLSREPDIAEVLTHWLAGDDYAHTGGGFMGKSWDGFVPGPAVWRECLRVLKPGGHLVAFGGTRTFDLQTVALRMAGFEIRDCLSWLYGCLADDTEVLTEHGWVNGLDVAEGDRIMQWDPTTGVLSLAPVAETFRAPWDGSMRVLRNADTDQILTPNHRVYHRTQQREQTKGVRRTWFDDEWAVSEAQDLTTCDPMKLPIAGRMHGEGIGGSDYAALLGWVWAEGGFDHSGSGVRIYQSSVNADKVAEIAALMDRCGVHKRYDRERTYRDRAYTESTWFFTGALAARVRADLPGKRPTYPLLWRMTMPEREAFLDAAMKGDGSGWPNGRGQQFYQKHEDDLIWFQTLLHTMDRAGKVGMRPNRPGGAVYLRNTATTELQHRHHKASSYEHYQGDVWCVRVPTGAFMARRNGRVFITGNSGFPKSANVSKLIDKAAGVEREVVGEMPDRWNGFGAVFDFATRRPQSTVPVTAGPATPEAAQWDGWGTALKPAWESIVLARKPLQVDGRKATVAANVLAHGTGALNIDASRIPTSDSLGGGAETATTPDQKGNDGWVRPWVDDENAREAHAERVRANVVRAEQLGRWPANVALSHLDACVEVGATYKETNNATYAGRMDGSLAGGSKSAGVSVWACVPGCPVRMLDNQTGDLTRWFNKPRSDGADPRAKQGNVFTGIGGPGVSGYTDSGGVSRFFYSSKASRKDRDRGLPDGVQSDHPTVKPTDLMRWLVKMVTPPNGVVLDPFAGSGTTGVAALDEGFRFVGIERDEHYANDLIRPRLEFADAGDQATKPAPPPSSALESEPEPERPEASTDWASSLFDGQPPEVTRDAGA